MWNLLAESGCLPPRRSPARPGLHQPPPGLIPSQRVSDEPPGGSRDGGVPGLAVIGGCWWLSVCWLGFLFWLFCPGLLLLPVTWQPLLLLVPPLRRSSTLVPVGGSELLCFCGLSFRLRAARLGRAVRAPGHGPSPARQTDGGGGEQRWVHGSSLPPCSCSFLWLFLQAWTLLTCIRARVLEVWTSGSWLMLVSTFFFFFCCFGRSAASLRLSAGVFVL